MGSVKLNCNNGMAGNKTVVEMTGKRLFKINSKSLKLIFFY